MLLVVRAQLPHPVKLGVAGCCVAAAALHCILCTPGFQSEVQSIQYFPFHSLLGMDLSPKGSSSILFLCNPIQSSNLQVRNAEKAGASAAIVFDDAYEALIIMSKPLGNPEPGIPSVFVSAKAGLVMMKLLVPGQMLVGANAREWLCFCMGGCFYVILRWQEALFGAGPEGGEGTGRGAVGFGLVVVEASHGHWLVMRKLLVPMSMSMQL